MDRASLGLDVRGQIAIAAEDALGAGLDSDSLRVVAGLSPSDAPEVWNRWWGEAVEDLGLVERDSADAILSIAKGIAGALQEGRIDPRQAAMEIWEITLLGTEHPPRILHPFIYIASEWDEQPEREHPAMARDVNAAADALLGSGE